MNNPASPALPAGSLRQMGAAVYDGLLLLAVFMVVTFIPIALTSHDLSVEEVGPFWHLVHQVVLLIALTLYYGISWIRKGQTLGMKAWNIEIRATSAPNLDWMVALKRLIIAALFWLTGIVGVLDYMHRHVALSLLLLAPITLNYLIGFFSANGTLTDRLSGTKIVRS